MLRQKTGYSYRYGLLLMILVVCKPVWAQLRDLEVHGFISQGYLDSSEHDYWAPTQDGTFEFSEVGLNISKSLRDDLRLGMQFFARDLGDIGNHEVVIDWALGDYRPRDELGIRVGRIKQPIGLYNQERDVDFLRSTIWVPQSVYPDGNRDIVLAYDGFSIYGHLPGDLDYELYTGSLNMDEESPGTESLLMSLAGFLPYVDPSLKSDKLFGGFLKWNTPLDGLSLGGTFYELDMSGSLTLFDGTPVLIDLDGISLVVWSLDYQAENWSFTGEWSAYSVQDNVLSEPAGWYVQATYRINDRVELNAGYNEFFGNKNDKDGELIALLGVPNHLAWQKDTGIGARIDLGTSWTVKLEWHEIDGIGLIAAFDIPNLDNLLEPDWNYFGAKATFHF
ncbi:MAG: hypothetical protein QNK37_02650 [Acidobacteriota bacterium]|nr:hypothetical protein [Acidobacteriota bacterium]